MPQPQAKSSGQGNTPAWIIHRGDTFIFTGRQSHLWIVITTPAGTDGQFVMVNLSTERGKGEGACVLVPADHPSFISHESEVRYKDARSWNARGFAEAHQQGMVKLQPPLSTATLAKIQDGAFRSELFKYFKEVCGHLVNPVAGEEDVRVKARRMLGMRYP